MAKEIFISYSRKDFDKVKAIKDEIDHELGINCWMDLDSIESGEEFMSKIIAAINSHDTFLFMLSQNSMQSEWALDELSFAKRKKKRVILVYIEPCEMSDEFYFSYHKYDSIDWVNSLQHNKLIDNLHKWFEESKQTRQAEQKPMLTSTNELSYITSINRLEAYVTGIGSVKDTHIVIPQNIIYEEECYRVVSISLQAFAYQNNIKSVIIPSSVTTIGQRAFPFCSDLEHVEIGENVISIGSCAFCGCAKLQSIDFPDSVTTIGEAAFSGCSKLTSVAIPKGVTKIERHTFSECHSLTSVIIPDSVTSIAREAFDQCENLKSVVVPRNAQIDGYAFPGWCKVIRR